MMHNPESVSVCVGLSVAGGGGGGAAVSIFPWKGHKSLPGIFEYRIKGADRRDSHAHCVSEELTQPDFKVSLVLLL